MLLHSSANVTKTYSMGCVDVQVERDGRYAAFVRQQPWHNQDTLDARFQQRIAQLVDPKLLSRLPQVAQLYHAEVGGLTTAISVGATATTIQLAP